MELPNLDGIVTRRQLVDSGDVMVADHVAVTGDGGQPGSEGRVIRQEPLQALKQFGRILLPQVLFLPEQRRSRSVLTQPQPRPLVPDPLTGAQYLLGHPSRRDLHDGPQTALVCCHE